MKKALLRCVDELEPRLLAAEERGYLSSEDIAPVIELGFFDLVRPRHYGGAEVEYEQLLDLILGVAERNGSLAWAMMIMSQHNIVARFLPRSVTDVLFEQRPMLMASCAFPPGKAERQDKSYVISGTWKYATGIHFANWLLVDADISNERQGRGARFIVPASACEIGDDWDVIGMRASGSQSITLSNVPVPASMRVDHLMGNYTGEGTEGRIPRRYRIPYRLLTALGTIAPSVGMLKGMLSGITLRAGKAMSIEEVTQNAEVFGLASRVHTVETGFRALARQVTDFTYRPELFTLPLQHDVLLRCAQIGQQCRELSSEIFAWAGTKSISRAHPLARRMADIHVMSTHHLMRLSLAKANSALVGMQG